MKLSKEEFADLVRQIPQFELKPKAVYEAMACDASRKSGECWTWADVRLSDMKRQLPSRESIRDRASVRAVYLWYLAFKVQLRMDMDSAYPELRVLAAREMERFRRFAGSLKHIKGGAA